MNDALQAFQNWWDTYAYPKILSAPGNFIIMRHIDDIKNAAKECWVASWTEAKKVKEIK